jgi:hypothetical protein
MIEKDASLMTGRVRIENVNHPGRASNVDAGMYRAMRIAIVGALPAQAPGLTQAELLDALLPRLPDAKFPGGAKAGWWAKAVQLDLEAKHVIEREQTTPLRWHRTSS